MINKTNTLIQEFREKFGKNNYFLRDRNAFNKGEWFMQSDIEQFLIKAIDQTAKEAREEIENLK